MSTWLMAIVFNAVRMELRRRARRKLLSLNEPTNDGQYAISTLSLTKGQRQRKLSKNASCEAL